MALGGVSACAKGDKLEDPQLQSTFLNTTEDNTTGASGGTSQGHVFRTHGHGTNQPANLANSKTQLASMNITSFLLTA
jgi:hypothetical protein